MGQRNMTCRLLATRRHFASDCIGIRKGHTKRCSVFNIFMVSRHSSCAFGERWTTWKVCRPSRHTCKVPAQRLINVSPQHEANHLAYKIATSKERQGSSSNSSGGSACLEAKTFPMKSGSASVLRCSNLASRRRLTILAVPAKSKLNIAYRSVFPEIVLTS